MNSITSSPNLVTETVPTPVLDAHADKVYTLLCISVPLCVSQISAVLGIPQNSVRHVLKRDRFCVVSQHGQTRLWGVA